jgi:hypothetical protein
MAGAASIAAGIVGTEPLLNSEESSVQAAPSGSNQRANACAKLRRDAANAGLAATPSNLQHPQNNDENIYPNKLGSYSKGLPHNNDGTVDLTAYAAFLKRSQGRRRRFNCRRRAQQDRFQCCTWEGYRRSALALRRN